jgi:hypothetical protein
VNTRDVLFSHLSCSIAMALLFLKSQILGAMLTVLQNAFSATSHLSLLHTLTLSAMPQPILQNEPFHF